MGPSGTVFLITRTGCSKNVPSACSLGPLVVIESWLLFAHLCMGLILKLDDSEVQPPTQHAGYYASADHMKWNFNSAEFGDCQYISLDVPLVKLIGSCSDFF